MKLLTLILAVCVSITCLADDVIRAGIIGLDTSHCIAFTKTFNSDKAKGDVAKVKIVAAYPGGSKDIPLSINRVAGYTKQLKDMHVEIANTIPELLEKVDVVLIESVDGRPHLEQAKPVFEAHKPVFIDKPIAGTLADAMAIEELGEKTGTPWFAASSLRYGPKFTAARTDPKLGKIVGCAAWSPCHLEPHHPDLFWYGVHGVEMLYTVMGEGCVSVSRTSTKGTEVVVGAWKDGRIGTFRGIKDEGGFPDYGVVLFGSKAVTTHLGFEGYEPLVGEIAKFFVTKKSPVANKETIEVMAFMEAADESKRQGGAPVTLESVMEKAKAGEK